MTADQFYIDVTGSDPFAALEDYGMRVRQAQEIELSMYDFPTVCLFYAEAQPIRWLAGRKTARWAR